MDLLESKLKKNRLANEFSLLAAVSTTAATAKTGLWVAGQVADVCNNAFEIASNNCDAAVKFAYNACTGAVDVVTDNILPGIKNAKLEEERKKFLAERKKYARWETAIKNELVKGKNCQKIAEKYGLKVDTIQLLLEKYAFDYFENEIAGALQDRKATVEEIIKRHGFQSEEITIPLKDYAKRCKENQFDKRPLSKKDGFIRWCHNGKPGRWLLETKRKIIKPY